MGGRNRYQTHDGGSKQTKRSNSRKEILFEAGRAAETIISEVANGSACDQ